MDQHAEVPHRTDRQVAQSETAELARRKALSRADARGRRRALPEAYRATADAAIRRRVGELVVAERVRCVGLYASLPGEVDLDDLVADLLARGVAVAFPRTAGGGEMHFHRVTDLPHVTRGAPAIREPAADLPVVRPPLVIVPGLAFDTAGRRLGQGGGYYDRWLALDRSVLAAGVCRARELVEDVPVGPQDAVLDAVVTEDAVYR